MQGRVISVNISPNKGEKKLAVDSVRIVAGRGVADDVHFGEARQVSLLASESINRKLVPGIDLKPGDFGENFTVAGIDLLSLGIGRRLLVGREVILQINEIGKVCERPCSIGQRLGECVMPREGVFAKALRSGTVKPGDTIEQTVTKVGAVLTSSDRCASGEREDLSGHLLVALLEDLGVTVVDHSILPDEEAELRDKLIFLADRCSVDILLSTGGTGFGMRDRMPEATLAVLESPAPGIAEAIRQEGMRHTPFACLSRGVSGLRGRTLIINLPGSSRAIDESSPLLRAVIPHALEIMHAEVSDCGTALPGN